MAKESQQMRLNRGPGDGEIILDYLGGANAIIKVLISKRGRQEDQSKRKTYVMEAEVRVM